MRLVVDASVAIKWVVAEADSLQATAITRHDLVAPELIFSECCNALWRLYRRNPATLTVALQSLATLLEVPLKIIPVQALVRRSLVIALDLDHPAYDCLYLALAELCSAKVVSADKRFLSKTAAGPYAHLAIDLQTAATD